jgi:hypothetical protein
MEEGESKTGRSPIAHRLAENEFLTAFARLGTPVLLGVIAWFGNQSFNDIRESQKDQAAADKQQTSQIAQVNSQVQVLNTKVDFGVLQRIQDLDRRMQLLEEQNRVLRGPK